VSDLSTFDVLLKQRRRRWLWSVCTIDGARIMTGSGRSRSAANYEATRALFLMLLSAPYRSGRRGTQTEQETHPQRLLSPTLQVHRALR